MAITRVNSRDILDRTIKNVDISDSAEIADTKLGTIQTSGKVSNSATTGTPYATPSTLALRDTSGNCTFNALHANTTVTADVSVRSTSIEGTTSVSLVGTVLKPPVLLTRQPNEVSVLTGLDILEIVDTISTGTLATTQFSTVVGTIETPPTNPKDLVNKEYVDTVALIGAQGSYANNAAAISGGLTAGQVYTVAGSNPRLLAIVF